eukprot:1762366-Prymnesium_polylepis.1
MQLLSEQLPVFPQHGHLRQGPPSSAAHLLGTRPPTVAFTALPAAAAVAAATVAFAASAAVAPAA